MKKQRHRRPKTAPRIEPVVEPDPAPAPPPSATPSPSHGVRTEFRQALRLFLAAFVVYNLNLHLIAAGDTFPARFLPFAIWGRGSVTLESVKDVTRAGHEGPLALPYWMMLSPQGQTVSSYPIVTPVLVTPLYAPAAAVARSMGWRRHVLVYLGLLMEKLAASITAAATVGLLYLLLRRRLERREATWLALAFAFGTNTWVTCSQALWQHGTTQLLLVAALLAITGGSDLVRCSIAGAACGLIPLNRPPDVFLALGVAAAVLWQLRARAWPLAAAGTLAALPFVAYNAMFFGHPGGGYFRRGLAAEFFKGNVAEGIAGLLVSPGKGLFVFSPFLLLLLARFRRRSPGDAWGPLDAALALSLVPTFLLLARGDFRGGYSYGARFLSGALPILFWLLAPSFRDLGTRGRRLFLVGAVPAVAIQIVGAFCYPMGLSDLGNVWSPRQAPFLVEARGGLHPPTLLGPLRSRIPLLTGSSR